MSTTAARAKEADEASAAFQLALSLEGARAVSDALDLWNDVPLDVRDVTARRWLEQAIKLIAFRRSKTRALALAYFRLVRALRTGRTIEDPYHPSGADRASLADLRQEFAQSLGAGTTYQPPQDDDAIVPVDEIPGLRADLDKIDDASEAEARIDLQALGPNNLTRKTAKIHRDIKTGPPASLDDVDAQRAKAHKDAGNRQAASSGRIAMNGARSAVHRASTKDKSVLGWVRVSRTGTPCGWCAMLISRGPVYKSKASAQFVDDLDLYHDNCHCYAEPVYSEQQYANSPLFDLNRRYADLWPKVTKGLGGKAALSAWRNFIRREQQGAQAAAA